MPRLSVRIEFREDAARGVYAAYSSLAGDPERPGERELATISLALLDDEGRAEEAFAALVQEFVVAFVARCGGDRVKRVDVERLDAGGA